MANTRLWAPLALAAVLAASVLGGAYTLTDRLLYPYRPAAWWAKQQTPDCSSPWLQDGFRDLRAGRGQPIDMSCDEALAVPGVDTVVTNDIGWTIHYRVYPAAAGVDPAAPLWLHVHGVTGHYLHGTRYLMAAKRQGFQLAAMDMSNHGLSQHDGSGAAYGCREWHDVVAVFKDLRVRYPERDVMITGSSMGSMAVQAAAPELIAVDPDHHWLAAALESAIPSVRGIVFEGLQTPPLPGPFLALGVRMAGLRAGYDFDACRPVAGATALARPTLLQQPGADELVPEALARHVYEALPLTALNTWRSYPNARHSQAWNYAPEQFEADLKAIWQVGLRYRASMVAAKPGAAAGAPGGGTAP